MQTRGRRHAVRSIGVVVFVLLCGCSTLKNHESTAAEEPAANTIKLASASEAVPQGAEPTPDRAQQQLALCEAQRKALALRVQQLQSVLEEKDAALVQASRELQAANAEVKRIHQDLKRWKQETEALREKLRKSEEDTLDALQSVVPTLERMGDGK
jgi:chromosome segregation ATPase